MHASSTTTATMATAAAGVATAAAGDAVAGDEAMDGVERHERTMYAVAVMY